MAQVKKGTAADGPKLITDHYQTINGKWNREI